MVEQALRPSPEMVYVGEAHQSADRCHESDEVAETAERPQGGD